MNADNTNHTYQPQEEEIDLIEILKPLWIKRKFILKIVVIFMFLGLVIALLTPKQYTASTTIVPQSSDNKSSMGGLSGLAAMAGINLNTSTSMGISPKMYPQIINSVPFQLELMNAPVKFSTIEKPISLYQYYDEFYKPGFLSILKKYTVGLPGVIVNAIKGKNNENKIPTANQLDEQPIQLTQKQVKIKKITEKLIEANINDKEGYVKLSCTMPDAVACADLVEVSQNLLQKYVTNFKIKKAKAQHDFIESRYNEAKKRYEDAQMRLAYFRDHNQDMATSMARAQVDQLNGEFTLQYNVYSELAKQLEQAKIQVKEDTPVFSIIEPVMVPKEKSKPNRPMIIAVFIFLGFIGCCGYILGKQYWKDIKVKLQTPKEKTIESNTAK